MGRRHKPIYPPLTGEGGEFALLETGTAGVNGSPASWRLMAGNVEAHLRPLEPNDRVMTSAVESDFFSIRMARFRNSSSFGTLAPR